ncbi:tripartite tricarboxylate transporter substrate binding protein [Comamonas sp. J-3]
MRKAVMSILVAMAAFSNGVSAQSSNYPSKPVAIMVPYPAGAASDITARALQGPIAKALSGTVITENLGGANGAIGAAKVLNAPADGAYIFQGSPNELILAGLTNKAVKYKPQDFEMLAPVAISPYILVTRGDLPVASIDELVALGKKAQTPLAYGSGGVGSMIHLVGAAFGSRSQIALTHVPYKGGAPLLAELAGGQIDFAFLPMQANYLDLQREGRLKIIATLEPKRLEALPQVPSVNESKTMNGFNYTIWTAYMAKKGTPPDIMEKLRSAIYAGMQDATARKTLEAQSKIIFAEKSSQENTLFYKTEIERLSALVKSIDYQAE